jgi:hypothetical protein
MPMSVILLLNRMAAADGITAEPITGVLNHAIRDYDPIVSPHLPTYFTPPIPSDGDPTPTLDDLPPGEIELADEVGLGPPADSADEIGYAEAGGVPRLRNDDSSHLNDPIHYNPDAFEGGGDIGVISGVILGEPSTRAGVNNMRGVILGVMHTQEGMIRGVGVILGSTQWVKPLNTNRD